MKKDVLGVFIDDVDLNQAIEKIVGWLKEKGGKRYVVTPNPEFLMLAQKDSQFREILNKADLAIPDGIGLKLSGKITNILPGVDLVDALCQQASKWGFRVGFLGGRGKVAKEAAECLLKKYPGLKVVFADNGPQVDAAGNQPTDYKLPIFAIDILFVGFGQGKQEKWIAKNLDNLNIKVAMGVGGSFDYLSGAVLRAPLLLRKLGLEWLFRLILQPWRIKRQLALLKFTWAMLH